MRKTTTLRVQAVLENVPLAIDCAGQTARVAGFSPRQVQQIQVAVDEACANVVQHAYACCPPGEMEITCDLDEHGLVIRVRDWGQGFDPDDIPPPTLDSPLEERSLGGLGLFLIHQFMDHFHYVSDPERGNELIMVKHYQECAPAAPGP